MTFHKLALCLSAMTAIASPAFAQDHAGKIGVIPISVDTQSGRRNISPLIYGASFADTATIADLRIPIDRSGGNSASTYNWVEDARNTGRDWFYESLQCDQTNITDQFGSRFVSLAFSSGSLPMLTIPYGGWVARLGANHAKMASYSVAKYGTQKGTDQWMPDAGDGEKADGALLKDNDPFDAQIPDDLTSERKRVMQSAAISKSSPHYYILDNEPSLWFLIHHDTHPFGPHAKEIAEHSISTAKMIKSADPHAIVVGPEEWGWNGYFNSGYDQQTNSQHDRQTQTDGMDYVPWLLTQWKKAGHPVDVFSLHYYPQGGEYSEDTSPAMEHSRNVSTRDLWDTSYHNPSWINNNVSLIPRMRSWVNQYYVRGTPIALTEYSWGGENSMNGATAQADVLGILGREGMDIATRWIAPKPETPVYKSMKIYRNYDGKGSGFGTVSVKDETPDPDHVSSFAALRPDGALTIIAINKDHAEAPVSLTAKGYTPKTVETYRLSQNTLQGYGSKAYPSEAGALSDTLPAQSVTLYILHK